MPKHLPRLEVRVSHEARQDIRPTYLYQFEKMVEAHQAFRARTIGALQQLKVAPARPRKPARKK